MSSATLLHRKKPNTALVKCILLVSAVVILVGSGVCLAASDPIDAPPLREPNEPSVAEASGDGQSAIANIKYPGLKCELFAAEPEVANIVAFHRDYQGRMFVCETFRQDKGIEDNRAHTYWMDEELAAQTVQDRVDYILKYHPDAEETYTRFDDRIRVIEDTDADGKADQSKVFAKHFNRISSGSGAGVLSYHDKVYYTNIPTLFELTDSDGDGVSDSRNSLHEGYGVHFAYRGHDLHGLVVGPDGRLYFSIGDRGYHLPEQGIKNPDSGGVFRCELDGSHLEVVATGMRNPQELAFDAYGNLFTGENNSDSGDMARWVFVVPGGDTGWRFYYQYLEDRGPFNREKIWHAHEPNVPAYIIPPVENLSDGPSGLEYYPGTGFSEDFKNRFFLCDFRGGPTNSGIRSFRNKPVGAFFEVVDQTQPIWGCLPTDIDFGSDGKLYLSDWVTGWVGEDRGRIFAFSDEQNSQSEIIKQVQTLLAGGIEKSEVKQLVELTGHTDQRVRQEAQFELVARGERVALTDLALKGAADGEHLLSRLHGIWGLGQISRQSQQAPNAPAIDSELMTTVQKLLADSEDEVRAQAALIAGEAELTVGEELKQLLKDSSSRVRYFAAVAYGRIAPANGLPDVAILLEENSDEDPVLRHGGVMAMKHMALRHGVASLDAAIESPIVSVRLAACVALRHMYQDGLFSIDSSGHDLAGIGESIARMLNDADPKVALEAVRAIHDLPIASQMHLVGELTASNADGEMSDHRTRRIISANHHRGTADGAQALAKFAADDSQELDRRVDAVNLLGAWMQPSNRDPVHGAWRPVNMTKRNLADAQSAVSAVFNRLVGGETALTDASIEAASALELKEIGDAMSQLIANKEAQQSTRVAALKALGKLKDPGLEQLLNSLAADYDVLPRLLAATTAQLVSQTSPDQAVGLLTKSLSDIEVGQSMEGEGLVERQMALRTLGEMKDPVSANLLKSSMELLTEDKLAAPIRLDAVMAATARQDETCNALLEKHQQKLNKSGVPTDLYADTLYGGDIEKGAKIFYGKTEVSCVRCHRIGGTGGKVAPYLSAIGKTHDRRYILESIVEPSKQIAKGHAQVVVLTDEGMMHTGVVKEETDTLMALMDSDGNVVRVEKDMIDEMKAGKSGMPEDLHKLLTMSELRDLVAFLNDQVDVDSLPENQKSGHGE